MRYQERIYIQNANDGVRNKDILNINMSSDMVVFRSPLFSISGASKIDCTCYTGCTCPSGYTTSDCVTCKKVEYTATTKNGTPYTADTSPNDTSYGTFGTFFYENIDSLIYPINYLSATVTDNNGTGTAVGILSTNNLVGNVWGNPSSTSVDGRLNNIGVWSSSAVSGEWIGFTKCITINNSGVYNIGIAADNQVRFSLNGELKVDLSNAPANDNHIRKRWHVFPITLTSGLNLIEMEGYNISSAASFGVEIYSASTETLTGLTTSAQLSGYTVFSTRANIGEILDLGTTNGYSCPVGYALDNCVSAYTCVKITSTGATSACTVYTGTSYVITGDSQQIPITFNFTGNTDSFTGFNASFKYEVYKYSQSLSAFTAPALYKSNLLPYSGFSGTNITSQNIPVSGISLDGEYLVKGFYEFDVTTAFLNKLDKKIDTLTYLNGTTYGLYDSNFDYYFIALKQALIPNLLQSDSNSYGSNKLNQQVIIPASGITIINVTNNYLGSGILSLNGLVLANGYDYTILNGVITLSAETVSDDIITFIYTTEGPNNLTSDNISIDNPIVSGSTNNEGNNLNYYNSSTSKYEVYSTITPNAGNTVIIMINGVTLANGVDFYQSITNPKRFILEGDLMVGDLITIVYFPLTNVSNGLITNLPIINWSILTAPELVNGLFSLQVSTGSSFNDFYYTGNTNYIVGVNTYSDTFIASGNIGTTLYYRVKNEKNFETICSGVINSIVYSEIIPIIIQTNSINSY